MSSLVKQPTGMTRPNTFFSGYKREIKELNKVFDYGSPLEVEVARIRRLKFITDLAKNMGEVAQLADFVAERPKILEHLTQKVEEGYEDQGHDASGIAGY